MWPSPQYTRTSKHTSVDGSRQNTRRWVSSACTLCRGWSAAEVGCSPSPAYPSPAQGDRVTVAVGAQPLHRTRQQWVQHHQHQAGMWKQEPRKQQVVGTAKASLVLLLFCLFHQSPANAIPDNGRRQRRGRGLSPSVARGATKLVQPRLAGLRPGEMPAPAKNILQGLLHTTTSPGSKSEHLKLIQINSRHVKTCKYRHKHSILFALLNFCP